MNPILKAVIISLAFVTAGTILFGTGFILAGGFNRQEISYEKYSAKEEDAVGRIEISTDTTDVAVVISESAGEISIEYPIKTNSKNGKPLNTVEVNVTDGTLRLEEKKTITNTFFSFGDVESKITVTVPAGYMLDYAIDCTTADIQLPDGLDAGIIALSTTTGDVQLGEQTRAGVLSISATTGDIEVGATVVAETISMSVTSGNITLSNSIAAEEINLAANTGDIELNAAVTANRLEITGTTGDLEATRLIKVAYFDVELGTGDVDISGTLDAGDAKIDTTTGEICIKVLGLRDLYSIHTSTTTGDANFENGGTGERSLNITATTGSITVRFDGESDKTM